MKALNDLSPEEVSRIMQNILRRPLPETEPLEEDEIIMNDEVLEDREELYTVDEEEVKEVG